MDDFDATWDEIMSSMTGTETPAVDEAATAAAAPEAESPLATETAPDAVVETTPAETAAPVAEPAPAPEPPAAPVADWRETPEAKAILEKAQRWETIEQRAAEARRLQSQTAFQHELNELSDGDPERFQRLTNLAVTIATPLQQAAQMQHQRAETSEKSAAALFIAMEAVLDDAAKQKILDEHAALMSVEGVETMQRIAYGKRDFNQQLAQQLSAKDQQIQELQRQLAARSDLTARQQSGADAVDGGGGANTAPDQRAQMQQAEDMDGYFAAMFGRPRAA